MPGFKTQLLQAQPIYQAGKPVGYIFSYLENCVIGGLPLNLLNIAEVCG